MVFDNTNRFNILFGNRRSHKHFGIPSATTFMTYTMRLSYPPSITFLRCTCRNRFLTDFIRLIIYRTASMYSSPGYDTTICIMDSSGYSHITSTADNSRIIMSNICMRMFSLTTNNGELMNTIFPFIHFFVIRFILFTMYRYNTRCTVSTAIIGIWELRFIKYLPFQFMIRIIHFKLIRILSHTVRNSFSPKRRILILYHRCINCHGPCGLNGSTGIRQVLFSCHTHGATAIYKPSAFICYMLRFNIDCFTSCYSS